MLGLNAAELAANPLADAAVVQDLNADPVLPFADGSFDAAVDCVSIDDLVRPVRYHQLAGGFEPPQAAQPLDGRRPTAR